MGSFQLISAFVRRSLPAKAQVLGIGIFFSISALAQQTAPPPRAPLVLAPTVEGLLLCDAALQDPRLTTLEAGNRKCAQLKQDASPALSRLLDTLEPGGAKGQVQVGYTLTVQLLDLFRKTQRGWEIDPARLDPYLQLITKIQRPVVFYLAADHFDSQGPITKELLQDPQNLLQLANGTAPVSGYFGYQIVPYTLLADRDIPVNKYRFAALEYVAKRVKALPKAAQDRIVAFTLAGELHQMFPDFEAGMGAFQNVQVTDYSPRSVEGFRTWLAGKYGSVQQFNARTGLSYAGFDAVPAPAKDIRKDKLNNFGEHYDAFAAGVLPLSGWLWDPERRIKQLELYLDGKPAGPVDQGLNRLDVYRADESTLSPNVGFRRDLDYRALAPGRHLAQVVAESGGKRYLAAQVEFVVGSRSQDKPAALKMASAPSFLDAKGLSGVRSWLDLPKPLQDVYFNPVARDWDEYRALQVKGFLAKFHDVALKAGLPADKLYSHQIVPQINSTWNSQLFAVDATMEAGLPWKHGLNMYGGSTNSDWMRQFMADRKITDYGVPEFNPQQWKSPGVHLEAMRVHYAAGARFVSPYYFSLIPDRFRGGGIHGVNRMELRPDNKLDGSDRFYEAIREFAKQ
ncbi:hypothetical protein AAFF27_23090 [Xylophilus sp. GW821-FHT01B05]